MSRRELGVSRDHCVIVPYCEPCAKHVTRATLLEQGALAGSVLIAVSSAILLSLSWLPLWAILPISTMLTCLPLAMVHWLGVPRQLGHSARGRALWVASAHVVFSSTPFVREVAARNGTAPRETRLGQSRIGGWNVIGPLVALILSPFCHQVFCPSLRVLNFTDSRLTLLVDDHVMGFIEPTSGESPAAGEQFRVPSGRRHLRVQSAQGDVSSDVWVTLRSGSRHLFAPGAKPGCLYVQRVAYGRSSLSNEGDPRVVALQPFESLQRFWVVAPDIDPWFVPERSVQRGLTTGGVVSLLRMGRCR